METLAPPVVAVIVTCDPGPWFTETLRAFASQEYPELSVLVLDAGSAEDPSADVARELPGAFVRRLGVNRGFGASANEALSMVEGASYFLFCHDDVAPAPDAVHLLVEESYRSNAGVVAPKLVSWDDPGRLLHVGMAVDKGGAVVDRVEPGEVDHGQHDAVRDVFLAPGGCTLVRADLFTELGGFDADIFAMGEDLDLCWRAQIAGARVLVAPQARVRHLEVLASGRRHLPESVLVDIAPTDIAPADAVPTDTAPTDTALTDTAPTDTAPTDTAPTDTDGAAGVVRGRTVAGESSAVTLQSLQRRHELHVVLKAYGPFHLLRVLPQLIALASAEYGIAWASGHRDRAAAVAHAWRWNLVRRRAIRSERVEVRAHRLLDDGEVRRLQLHGSARLNAYVRRAVNQGLRAAHLGAESDVGEGEAARDSAHRRRLRADALSLRVVAWAIAVVVLVFGTRQVLGSGFPYVGQLLPLPSAGTLLHRFLSGWQPTGVGTTDPTSPATGILGVAGLVLLGGVGFLQKIVVLGCVPAGVLGMARLARPVGSRHARLASTLVYLAIPLPYNALATGRWDALVAYAACPWIVGFLVRASRSAPFGPLGAEDVGPTAATGPVLASGRADADGVAAGVAAPGGAPGAFPELDPGGSVAPDAEGVVVSRHDRHRRRWRTTLPGQILGLGALEALVCSVAPAGALLVLVAAAGLALGALVTGGSAAGRSAVRIVVTALGASAVATVLLMPWSVALLSGPDRWQAVTGLATGASTAPGWGSILRFSLGPIGDSPLGWAFLASAGLPLFIGSRWRLAWAGRAWVMAIVAWVMAWAVGHDWLGPVTPSPQVLLAPAAVGVALAVGLGVASFESDLPGYRFGWRQAATVAAAVAAALGVVPVLLASSNGRWDLPLSGYREATSWMAAHSGAGDFRVLWLGDPRVLPGGGWQLAPGLAYSISENGLGDATEMWSGSAPGAAAAIGVGVGQARRGSTVDLGRILAPYAIRYIVVVDNLAPSIPGFQSPVGYAPPADLDAALLAQLDLRQIIGQGGFEVFVDDGALPERAVSTSGQSRVAAASPVGADPALAGWRPVLDAAPGASAVTGRVPAGTVMAGVAPSTSWELVEPGGGIRRAEPIFGYAASFAVDHPGTVTVRFRGSWVHGLEIALELVLWVVVVMLLVGRRRSLSRLSVRVRPRDARRRRDVVVPGPILDDGGGEARGTPNAGTPDAGTPDVGAPDAATPEAGVAAGAAPT